MSKKIELWKGYEVEIQQNLLDDVDFVKDFSAAQRTQDFGLLLECTMGLIGGVQAEKDIRDHITEEKGYYSIEELNKYIEKIVSALPKAGKAA